MSLEIKKAKLKWHCRRGMLELDLFLQKYLELYLDKMTEEELDEFDMFLTNPDPDLYAWFMGYEKPVENASIKFVNIIQSINQPK